MSKNFTKFKNNYMLIIGEVIRMIYPSIDKLLNQVGSKYLLVNVVSRRSKEMTERNHYQMKENEYVSKKNIGRALEEISKDLIHIKTC